MIDYSLLNEAIQFYEQLGYKQVDMPWIASEQAMTLTWDLDFVSKSSHGLLVGSAEQAFLDAVINKNIIPGSYIATTPCFRLEQVIDEIHKEYFMKAELFINEGEVQKALAKMISDAVSFYGKHLNIEVIKTNAGYDIIDCKNKIELGSYAYHSNKLVGEWVSGTAVALPRLSYVLSKQ